MTLPPDLRLATLTVYHFDETLKPLVTLHLDRLRANCPPGTVFYGAAVRMAPRDTAWLRDRRGVVLPDLPPLPATLQGEHNGALEALAAKAFADGATHVACFHQDSFPIHAGWLPPLLHSLDGPTMFVAAEPRSYNCCMLWDRRWQATGPAMLLTEADRASDAFARLRADRPDLDPGDGGIGHLLHAYRAGLRWHPLVQTGADLPHFAEVLGDSVFHLKAATRLLHTGSGPRTPTPALRGLRKLGLSRMLRWLPLRIRSDLRRSLTLERKDWAAPAWKEGSAEQKHAQLQALLADPDRFLAQARRAPSA